MEELPLRERSKLRRRQAIQFAGMRLFAERGYEATTLAEIAAAADVAPRTIPAYFPTKLDIALASMNAAAERLMAAFADAPGRTAVEVFVDWLEAEDRVVGPEERKLRAAMLQANPSLPVSGGAQTAALAEVAAASIATEFGVTTEHVAVQIMSGLLIGVLLTNELPVTATAAPHIRGYLIRAALEGAAANLHQRLPTA